MIRGFFDVRHQPPIPKVWVGLILPHRGREFAAIDFVVDTGASATALHPMDARRRLGFTGDELDRLIHVASEDRSLAGIGGTATYHVVPAQYLFVHDNGDRQVVNGQMRIAQPTPSNETVPSVLGRDLLEHFRIVPDRHTGEAQLQEATAAVVPMV